MKYTYLLFIVFHFWSTVAHAQLVFPYSKNDQYGLIDVQSNIVLPPKYARIDLIPNQWSNTYTIYSDLKYGPPNQGYGSRVFGILDHKGKEIVPARFPALDYDGNMKYAFMIRPYDTITVVDIRANKIVHRQQFSTYKSKGGLVAIARSQVDTTTILFHNNKTMEWKGFVNIIYHDDTYYYECSDYNSYTYYNDRGKKVDLTDVWDISEFMVEEAPPTSINDQLLLEKIKKNMGSGNITPVFHPQSQSNIVSVIYKDPVNGQYKLLDMDGQVLYENNEMRDLSKMSHEASPYLKYKAGVYWGLITQKGEPVLKPEFINDFRMLTKNYNGELWAKHKSGYAGVLDVMGKIHLPKESGYVN